VASVVFGSLALVNSTRIKEMFSFSSVSNTGWILLAVLFSSSAGLVYMLCYMVISFFSLRSSSDTSGCLRFFLLFLFLVGLFLFFG